MAVGLLSTIRRTHRDREGIGFTEVIIDTDGSELHAPMPVPGSYCENGRTCGGRWQ